MKVAKWISLIYYTTPKGLIGVVDILATDIRPLRGLL